MQPDNPFITDGATSVTPLGLAFTVAFGLLLVALPRRYALWPLIALVCYMTMGERLMIAGLNFTMIRILLFLGWIRLLTRGEFRSLKLNRLDKSLLWWTLASVVTYVLLWQSVDAFKYKIGMAYNAVGFYFMFRFLVRDMDDVLLIFKLTAMTIAPLAGLMLVEKATGLNPFAVFGGVSPVTAVRDGTLRCQGPFAHPILAGTFGATILPFFIPLWSPRFWSKIICLIGVCSATVITVTSGSSGPIMAYFTGILAFALWRLRKHMRKIRWGLVLALALLQCCMKVPIWFLLARVDIFSGSTGFHRALLIDRSVANVGDWWLIGTKSTLAWASEDQGLFDVTNQYLIEGADGGLITMILFIVIIGRGFQAVGLGSRKLESDELERYGFPVWALGTAVLAHTVSYISISYFDQNVVNWYLLLGMIGSMSQECRSWQSGRTREKALVETRSKEEVLEAVLPGADGQEWWGLSVINRPPRNSLARI